MAGELLSRRRPEGAAVLFILAANQHAAAEFSCAASLRQTHLSVIAAADVFLLRHDPSHTARDLSASAFSRRRPFRAGRRRGGAGGGRTGSYKNRAAELVDRVDAGPDAARFRSRVTGPQGG